MDVENTSNVVHVFEVTITFLFIKMSFYGLAPSSQTICQVGKYEGLIDASQSTEWNKVS